VIVATGNCDIAFQGIVVERIKEQMKCSRIAEASFLDLGVSFSVGLRGIHAKAGKQQGHGCSAARKFSVDLSTCCATADRASFSHWLVLLRELSESHASSSNLFHWVVRK
jgi:hypothetical protein